MDIKQKLDQLSEYSSQLNVLDIARKDAIAKVLTPEIQAQLDAIDDEYAGMEDAVNANLEKLQDEIEADVLAAGASVKGTHLQAIWMKGRVSWDTKALDGYAAAHPEIAPFRKEGQPTVSIRLVK